MTTVQRYQAAEKALHEAAVEYALVESRRPPWLPIGLVAAAIEYAQAAAEVIGLSFTEQEADRNAALGREQVHECGPGCSRAGVAHLTAPRPCCHTTGPHHHPACQETPWTPDEVVTRPSADLVDVQPTPMRIVDGQRYADNEGRLYEGDSDGGLWQLAAGYVDAGEVEEIDGLHAVKVVPA